MPFTLEELLPEDQRLRAVQLHESVPDALALMYHHGFDQLPVVAEDGKTSIGQAVTFESILQALSSFATKPEMLQVRDVARNVRTYPADADILSTLDDIHRDNFALIVDENNVLTGLVTTADTTLFFRDYSQYLMQIEGIESRIKDAILALYAGDDASLESAIAAVTDRVADIRRKLPAAICAYLEKSGFNVPNPHPPEALSEAEKRLCLPSPGKAFERLSFDDFTHVLLNHPQAPRLPMADGVTELRNLLQQVRDARNKLAHFRGELTPQERRTIQFASDWLERHLPIPQAEPPSPPSLPSTPASPNAAPREEDDDDSPHGSYAPLAAHLKSQASSTTSVTLTFPEIESILGKELPNSAREYRAWWANDPTKPQSTAWLEEGWRTTGLSMTDRRLTFVRTNDREEAYILFFAGLNTRLQQTEDFPLRNVSPQGNSWMVLSSFQRDKAYIIASFTRKKQLRLELYIDTGDKDQTKRVFDELLARKPAFESVIGEPLSWERLDAKRASRIAAYTKAQILTDADSPELLDWAAKKATDFHRAFSPEFPTDAPA